MLKTFILTLVLLVAGTTAARAAVFYPTSFTLGNGLQIIVVPNHLAPAVNQMVWYKVGSVDELPGKTGLAHYLEHLMFRGTTNVAPGEFSKIIAAQGGSENAFTSYNYTAYFETVAADRLPMIMQMEADRMHNLQIKSETATPELSVVLDERQERTGNNPEGRFKEKILRALFPHDPYGRPVIGWKSEIENLSAEDATKFYQSHYAPNNAVVIISGDVDPDQVMRLAASIYGSVPRQSVAPRHVIPSTSQPPLAHRVVLTDVGVEQPQIEMHVVRPSYTTQKNNEAYALEVLSEILDGGEVGLLYRSLVAEQGIASGVATNYDPDNRGNTDFMIALTPHPNKDPQKVAEALQDVLKNLAAQGVTDKLVADAEQRLLRDAVFARDSLMMPGYAFGMALTTGHTVADVEAWPDHIKAVNVDDVNKALKNLVADPHNLVGFLLPDPHASAAAREAAQPVIHHDMGIR